MACQEVDVAIPLGLSYEYMNVILDARYNVSLTKASKGDWDNCKNKVSDLYRGLSFYIIKEYLDRNKKSLKSAKDLRLLPYLIIR